MRRAAVGLDALLVQGRTAGIAWSQKPPLRRPRAFERAALRARSEMMPPAGSGAACGQTSATLRRASG